MKLTWVGTPTPLETRVTRADAPKVLEYNDMRWELEAFGGGTRLTLWHNIDRRFISWGAAGWHICFDVLDRLLSGTPIGRIAGADAMKFGGWQRLNAEYAKQFGIEAPDWPPKRLKSRERGGPNELEQMGSADPPLAVDCLYVGSHRQRRRRGTEEVYGLGGPPGAAPARLAPVHRSVLVRAAVCRQVAEGTTHMKRPVAVESASALIDKKIKELGDWRGKTLAKVREIIHEADPEIVEEWKWSSCIAGDSRLVPRRHRLHGRDLQEHRQNDICQGSCVEGPFRSIQLQPRRECQACHRHPARRQGRRGGVEGSHPRCSGA